MTSTVTWTGRNGWYDSNLGHSIQRVGRNWYITYPGQLTPDVQKATLREAKACVADDPGLDTEDDGESAAFTTAENQPAQEAKMTTETIAAPAEAEGSAPLARGTLVTVKGEGDAPWEVRRYDTPGAYVALVPESTPATSTRGYRWAAAGEVREPGAPVEDDEPVSEYKPIPVPDQIAAIVRRARQLGMQVARKGNSFTVTDRISELGAGHVVWLFWSEGRRAGRPVSYAALYSQYKRKSKRLTLRAASGWIANMLPAETSAPGPDLDELLADVDPVLSA